MFLANGLSATNTIWTGANNNDWFNAGNWDNGVPGLLDTATVLTDSVHINATADIKHLFVEKAAVEVSALGKLRIRDSDGIGLSCLDGRIYNYGLIRVNNPDSIGIVLLGVGTLRNFNGSRTIIDHSMEESIKIDVNASILNFATGLIQSDTCTGAVYNEGQILNAGTITLVYSLNGITTNTASLENHGTLVNLGTIEIDSSAENGIINSDSLNNSGTIDVHNCAATGLISSGATENSGSVMIANSDNGMLIDSDGSMVNQGATLISHIQVNGLFIEDDALVTNHDMIDVSNLGNHGIINEGVLSNHDLISVTSWGELNPESNGVYSWDSIYNDTQGRIHLNGLNIGSNGLYIIQDGSDTSVVENYGNIDIQQVLSSGIHNFGKIYNHDNLTIHDLLLSGNGITNQGLIENSDSLIIMDINNFGIKNINKLHFLHGGHVNISNINNNGIQNCIGAYLSNLGLLKIFTVRNGLFNDGLIENSDSISIFFTQRNGISTTDSFINEETGVIDITDVNNKYAGIENGNSSQTTAHFLNLGMLTLFDIDENGIKNEAIFTNRGSLMIDSTQLYGIDNRGHFYNENRLTITNTNNYGIINLDTLKNEVGGIIDVSHVHDNRYGISNEDGSQLTNDGDIFIHQISGEGIANRGDFTNNSLIDIDSTGISGILNAGTGVFSNSTEATLDVKYVTWSNTGTLFYNEDSATFLNDGELTMSDLDIEDEGAGIGIRCDTGTTFHITSNGSAVLMGLMNMADFLDVDNGAIFQVDGTFDISN